jgi:hypothetical protein
VRSSLAELVRTRCRLIMAAEATRLLTALVRDPKEARVGWVSWLMHLA